jgi:hypothetical protein
VHGWSLCVGWRITADVCSWNACSKGSEERSRHAFVRAAGEEAGRMAKKRARWF